MITGAVLKFFAALFQHVIGALPLAGPPPWIVGQSSSIGVVFADAGSMSVWFPTQTFTTVLGSLMTLWLVGFGIKFARIVVSLFTGGGGSAA